MNEFNARSLILSYLVNRKNQLSCSCDELLQNHLFDDVNELKKAVLADKENFFLLDKSNNETYIFFIPILFCPFEASETNCTNMKCKKIHLNGLCRFYIMDNCKYQNRCRKSHSTKHIYNNLIIQERHLNNINSVILVKLLKLSRIYKINLCKDPFLCDSSDCDNLHCCYQNFLANNCENANRNCKLGHSINYYFEHNSLVLEKRDLDNINEQDLKPYLLSAYFGYRVHIE